MTSTSTREKIVTEVEKLLMTLGKIWTQFVLEKKYGCAQQSKYIWCQKKYVIVCIIYVCYEPIGIQSRSILKSSKPAQRRCKFHNYVYVWTMDAVQAL